MRSIHPQRGFTAKMNNQMPSSAAVSQTRVVTLWRRKRLIGIFTVCQWRPLPTERRVRADPNESERNICMANQLCLSRDYYGAQLCLIG